MKHSYRTESCKRTDAGAAVQPLAQLFKSWLAIGLLLNLSLGQLQLPIGPLWLWLVLIPALCVLAIPGALKDLTGIRLHYLTRFNSPRRRAQATRRPINES